MYVTIDYILDNTNKRDLIQFLNDEGRTENEIDFYDSTDPVSLKLQNIIEDVESEIDGYLSSKYKLPLTTVPKTIRRLCFDKVIYSCYKRRHLDNMPDSIISLNKTNNELLARIQKGTFSLSLPEADSSNDGGGVFINKSSEDKYFNNDLMSRM